MKDVIFLKGKESAWVGVLLFLAIIIFIVPIALILIVRTIYSTVQAAKEQSLNPKTVSADIEKFY